MPKKKFKDTKVGGFLSKVAPKLLEGVGDVLPNSGALGILKNVISKDDAIPQQDKDIALELLKQDAIEMQEVTKRWSSDMKSDSWLSKNTRPMALIFLTCSMVLLIVLDSFDIGFNVDNSWIELLKNLLVTVYVAYFGSRGVEKFQKIKGG